MMLDKCQEYASEHNIMFSTDPNPNKSKTKCIFVCGTKKNLVKPAPLTLCGTELPWVSTATHLGHALHETGSKENDALVKRAIFIKNSVDVRETFSFASPVEILSAVKIYCASFYGCMLWDLCGEGATQVFNAWTTCMKLTWDVPRATRKYMVQQVLGAGLTSVKVDILARFAGFFVGLRKSPCYEVRVLANLAGRDMRTTTGRNLNLLRELSGLDPWVFGGARIKEELVKVEEVAVADADQWRLSYLRKLLEQRQILHYEGDKAGEESMSELISSLCIN